MCHPRTGRQFTWDSAKRSKLCIGWRKRTKTRTLFFGGSMAISFMTVCAVRRDSERWSKRLTGPKQSQRSEDHVKRTNRFKQLPTSPVFSLGDTQDSWLQFLSQHKECF